MQTIQLAIADEAYSSALRGLLMRTAGWRVLTVAAPDTQVGGVIVLDARALEALPGALSNPERVVLIARNEPRLLARAWEAGIVSVVSDIDPMDTALLAIMAARLKASKAMR